MGDSQLNHSCRETHSASRKVYRGYHMDGNRVHYGVHFGVGYTFTFCIYPLIFCIYQFIFCVL